MPPRPDDLLLTASTVAVASPSMLEELQPMTATESLLTGLQDHHHHQHHHHHQQDPAARPTVVLIDPLSTGVLLQQRVFAMGYQVVLVWSDRSQPASHQRHFERSGHGPQDFLAVIYHQQQQQDDEHQLEETLGQILAVSTNIVAVMCGSEHGVLLEDAVAQGLCQRLSSSLSHNNNNNNIRYSGMFCRQTKVDKHAQANTIRNAGLEAVRERLARSTQDVVAFLQTFAQGSNDDNNKEKTAFVVKPQTGAGSVGVMFCDSEEAVWDAYFKIVAGEHKSHCQNKYKHYSHAGVLLQEYLQGDEYIVNSVVRNGEIKTTAMFKYDKRPCNGAAFVCFSKELVVVGQAPELEEILSYAEQVLRAVGFQNGAVHVEIMYIPSRGPVLVELNCRLHGGNGAWVRPVNLCMGYDQLSVFMDAYLNQGKALYNLIPSRPVRARAHCQQVKMRSFVEGVLDCVIPEQWARIQALPSYLEHTFGVLPGDRILKTVDMPSVPGEITLVHEDKETLAKDYETLNEILREGIFQVKKV